MNRSGLNQTIFKILGPILVAMIYACAIAPREKPLSPNLTFSTGSSFLVNASTVALKGSIEFKGSEGTQSGGFQLLLSGPDSLAFTVTGPFGTTVFRMIILNREAYLFSNSDEGWVTLSDSEVISMPELGIENVSPFLLGLFAFPQFYLKSSQTNETGDEYSFRDEKITVRPGQGGREFTLGDPRSQATAVYDRRMNFADGFYPSRIKIFEADKNWEIVLGINKIRLNPKLPERTWQRE